MPLTISGEKMSIAGGKLSSDMLQMAAKSGHDEGSQNHIQPISHSQNMDAGWNTPIFQDNLEIFPGAHNAKLDLGLGGSIDHEIISIITKDHAFGADLAGAFSGTILSQGNVGHEGLNLKLSGDTSASHIAPAAQTGLGDGIDVIKGGSSAGH